MPKLQFYCVLGLLIGGAVLATRGTPDPAVNLSSLTELWSDTLRDTDQIGMKLTRVSAADEMKTGTELAGRFGEQHIAGNAYVGAVGQTVAEHVRRHEIRYEFHLIDSPAINAFALPGGQIFVTTGMLNFVGSEAELAAVLGHEISHVDLRHCIERYQYEITLGKAGVAEAGQVVELAHRVATFSFTPDQELEADAQGQRMSIEAGYDPDAAAALFLRMQARLREPSPELATTPVGEITQSVGGALESYFRSHPPSAERASQLEEMVNRHHSGLHGSAFYIGKQNLRNRIQKSKHEYPDEYRTL
jgi:predicted Zn-dependent protease